MSSIFAMALEGADITGFTGGSDGAEMAKLDSETEAAMEAYITEDPVSFAEYVGECFEELKDSHTKEQAAEGYFAVKYMQAADESSKAAVMENLSDKIGDAWDAIKRFIAKVWEAIKKYAKKAWDFLKKRYELAKGMVTKYEKVLRNKKVDTSIKFDWAEINLKKLMEKRQSVIKTALEPIETKGIKEALNELRDLGKSFKGDNKFEAGKHILAKLQEISASAKEHVNSTASMAKELDDALWGEGKKGPDYKPASWETIKADAMHFASVDPSNTISEALGIYEKNTSSLNKLVGQAANEASKLAKDAMADSAFESGASIVRGLCRMYASGIQKVNSMAMSRLTAGAKTLQSQSIAACRKAITAKGTTSESTVFDFDSVIL